MSGPFGSSQWMYQSAAGFYPYEIEQSLRFNDDDSAYLSRTPAGAGNRKTWTWSGWVKRGNLGNTQGFFQGFVSTLNLTALRISSDNTISIQQYNEGSFNLVWRTQAVFRDPSAWYHIVASFDSTEASSSNSVKMYVNGNEQSVTFTSFEGSYVQNRDSTVNSVTAHNIGRYVTGNYFDGYMAEVNFIDGTALDPTSFGETKSGIWVPKAYDGAYGTNGFYLSFADSAAIGDDLSGNGNDWTANNLVATDVLLDSPTQNWATLNPLSNTAVTLSEGNLRGLTIVDNAFTRCNSTISAASGKWYFETLLGVAGSNTTVGVGQNNITNQYPGQDALSFVQEIDNARKGNNDTFTSYGTALVAGDVFMCAFDLNDNKIFFGKNGTWFNSSDPAAGTSPAFTLTAGTYCPILRPFGNLSGFIVANFGQDSSFAGNKTAQGNTDDNGVGDFYYAPPSGFLALCTANLPDPVIDPAQDDVPADYFNTVLYTGTGATQSITGVGYQPDFVWTKQRNGTNTHALYDVVRAPPNVLYSSETNSEETNAGYVNQFDADGFTVGSANLSNASGGTYVAWNWLAGNGTASNTDGSITSTVSVNQKAGFSVATFTDAGSACTIGHGLGVAPDVVIAKFRGTSGNWSIYHKSLGPTKRLIFTTSAELTSSGWWNNTAPTSTVFSLGSSLVASTTQVAYCFAEVEGYSKFGSYTGNGSTDGPFVYCGFRPAFVLLKRTDSAGAWDMHDAERDPYNLVDQLLEAQSSNAEASYASYSLDFLSNGFKLRGNGASQNASGGTFIFMAFAESPFKYANAR